MPNPHNWTFVGLLTGLFIAGITVLLTKGSLYSTSMITFVVAFPSSLVYIPLYEISPSGVHWWFIVIGIPALNTSMLGWLAGHIVRRYRSSPRGREG